MALAVSPFQMERLGVIMQPQLTDPHEAWGVLNPGGARAPDGSLALFPRLVAAGNYSRIGRARVLFAADGTPTGVERQGVALEPETPYEVIAQGGGVEDPRVTFVEALHTYVMVYTAYVPQHPRIALAISPDLKDWTRLGPLHYAPLANGYDLNRCGNKDGVLFPGVVTDPQGRPALAVLHRPTYAIDYHHAGCDITMPPCGVETQEHIWISYILLEAAQQDIHQLAQVGDHHQLLGPQTAWEQLKIGSGPPPVRLPYGWLLLYHAVSQPDPTAHTRYVVGAAVLDLQDPRMILYRSPTPVFAPEMAYEREGIVDNVVFPTATDARGQEMLDIYYGAADKAVGVARLHLPSALPRAV